MKHKNAAAVLEVQTTEPVHLKRLFNTDHIEDPPPCFQYVD